MRSRIIGCLVGAALLATGVWGVDRIAIRLVYAKHGEFLEDIDHRPRGPDLEYNSDGVRDTREAIDFPADDYNVILLGDSFLHGISLWPSESVSGVVEREGRQIDPRFNAINFGWVSSSPFLSLRLLKRIGARYHPDVIVLCIDMTDMHDDTKYQKYAEREGIFALVEYVPGLFLMLKDLVYQAGMHERVFGYSADRYYVLTRPLTETRSQFRDIRSSMDKLHVAASEMGAAFVAVVFPRHFQYSTAEAPKDWEGHSYTRMGPFVREPFTYFAQLDAPYPVHSALPDFSSSGVFPTTLYNDPHWNAAGARVAAKAIMRVLSEEKLLPHAVPSASVAGQPGP